MTMSDDYAILFVGANGCSPVSRFQCRLYGMTVWRHYRAKQNLFRVVYSRLHVILTMFMVRIWSFGFCEACTQRMGWTTAEVAMRRRLSAVSLEVRLAGARK